MEVEQLSGDGWTGCSAGLSKYRLDTRAIRQETRTGAEAVPGICQGRSGEPALGRSQRQIYLGSDAFIEKHAAPNKDLKEIPQVQLRAAKPSLERIFAKSGDKAIVEAYDHG
jgi:hypothetical protein